MDEQRYGTQWYVNLCLHRTASNMACLPNMYTARDWESVFTHLNKGAKINILSLNYLLTTWSRAALEKVIVTQLVKKFLSVFGARRFISMFIKGCSWYYPKWDEFMLDLRLWRVTCSGIWCRAVRFKASYISEEYVASIFRFRDGGDMLLRKVGCLSTVYAVLYPTRPNYSW